MARQPDPVWGWKRPDADGWREYHAVGTRQTQDQLKKLKCGDRLFLKREPRRGFKSSISIYNSAGDWLGWIEEKHSVLIAPAMDQGLRLEAVSAVSPDPDAFLVGLWLLIRPVPE